MNKEELEQTLVLIKPDALKSSLTGYVLSQLSEFHTGLRLAGAKIVHVNEKLAAEHYAEHREKFFYPALIDYIMGRIHYPNEPWKRRVVALVYQGQGATQKIRDICGPTNPHVARESRPGCIRALGTVVPLKDGEGNVLGERMDNLIHASATDAEAEREIKLWFQPADVPPSMRAFPTEVNEEHYYFRDGKLSLRYERGSLCLLAPGDLGWKSDMGILRSVSRGEGVQGSLDTVVAKYLINEREET